MKDDTWAWLAYAGENLVAAKILHDRKLYNPCLQNIQQGVEKSLKALLLEKTHSLRKTHSITELVRLLARHQISIRLTEEDCDLLDSAYPKIARLVVSFRTIFIIRCGWDDKLWSSHAGLSAFKISTGRSAA